MTPGRVGGLPLFYMGFAGVFAMSLVDARPRPVAATVAYGLLLFIVAGWRISNAPALAPMAPGLGPTIVAFALTAGAAAVAGLAAKRLSDSL